MTPLSIYRTGEKFSVVDPSTEHLQRSKGKLVASINARYWMEKFLNAGAAQRKNMIKDLEGE